MRSIFHLNIHLCLIGLYRGDLSDAGVHVPRTAGISGGPTTGASSVVLSGGYEDDVDSGETV